MAKSIGPSFYSELVAAGVPLDGFAWTDAGDLFFADDVSEDQKAEIRVVVAAHDPAKPAAPVIPDTVTRYQARAALAEAGLLDDVNAYFDALPSSSLEKLAWTEAPTVSRTSKSFADAAQALGISSEQVDALMVRAAQFT